MLSPGPAKITIHLNADTSAGNDFLHKEIFSLLYERVAGASLIVRRQVSDFILACISRKERTCRVSTC